MTFVRRVGVRCVAQSAHAVPAEKGQRSMSSSIVPAPALALISRSSSNFPHPSGRLSSNRPGTDRRRHRCDHSIAEEDFSLIGQTGSGSLVNAGFHSNAKERFRGSRPSWPSVRRALPAPKSNVTFSRSLILLFLPEDVVLVWPRIRSHPMSLPLVLEIGP